MKKWAEFFQDGDGSLSMTRLLCFLSFFPATYVVIIDAGEGTLGWFLGAYVGGYVGGRTADVFGKRRAIPEQPKNITVNQPGNVNV